jgi:hypothetical protein
VAKKVKKQRSAAAPKQQASTAKQQAQAPKAPEMNASEIIKERLKNANKSGLLGVLGEVKNTSPEEWKDADKVKDLAKKLAQQFKLPVSDERLDQFMKAYKDATKGGEPKDPEQLIKKYGHGIDEQSINEMKKFIK